MPVGFFERLGDHRNVQPATDDLGDQPEGHALFRNRVEWPAFGAALERKPIDPRRVEPMHRRPAVVAGADVGGHALLPRGRITKASSISATRYSAASRSSIRRSPWMGDRI
jgi:hypothetical protein